MSSEKQIDIKGLSIGMDIQQAWQLSATIFGKTCKVDSIGWLNAPPAYLNRFAKKSPEVEYPQGAIISKNGFFIKSKKRVAYLGYVSADKTNKIMEICLSGQLVDDIYSTGEVSAEEFQDQLTQNFNLQPMYWIPQGWQYDSELGYTLTIMTDKTLELKKSKGYDINNDENEETQKEKKRIKF